MATLDFECINTIWSNVVKSKPSRTVLYLSFSAPYRCIANIIKVPTCDTSELEDNPIAGLIGSIKTGSVSGATAIGTSDSTLAERQTQACHCGQKTSI
ncbi:MAG TPA: hypothetical protein DCY88_30670 [Cyanobacteria bacterium UBA11372]|nr:hypothetical protein [Cyanobacteria bacterium UBA11372]